jgi:molybdate transport system permease protein
MGADLDLSPLLLTLKVAGFATLIALAAGLATAILFARLRFFGRDWIDALLTLPLVMPPTVLGYYLIVLIGRNGWIGHSLEQMWS